MDHASTQDAHLRSHSLLGSCGLLLEADLRRVQRVGRGFVELRQERGGNQRKDERLPQQKDVPQPQHDRRTHENPLLPRTGHPQPHLEAEHQKGAAADQLPQRHLLIIAKIIINPESARLSHSFINKLRFMDTKLLLKEKDYELLETKRIIAFKHAFNDPLINPPKRKAKPTKALKAAPQPKEIGLPANNILSRLSKPVKQSLLPDQKTAVEQQIQQKQQTTPWSSILNFFIKTYESRRQPPDTQIPNPFGSQGLKADEQFRSTASSISQGSPQKQTKTTISIRTYVKILENMKKELRTKWKENDKVGSLQVTIQACKLLHDTSNAKFHALKFAYIMEIVEQFGINVFKRIKSLSFPQHNEQKIDEITIKDLQGTNVPESAQEICRNWLLKISSIRQLIPRTIVETTLLRLHFFLDNGVKAKKVLERLSRTNRCFGEYINCIFFCTFLIRMGKEVLPQDKDYILDILDDVFFYIKQGKTKFSRQDISYDDFFVILEPFFISSFESLAENLSREKFKRFCSILPQNPHPVILINFIQSFSSSLLINYSIDIVKMLQKLQGENKFKIYKKLFERLRGIEFSQSGEFIILSWTDLSQVKDIEVLLELLGPFSTIIFKNLPRYEKNKFYSLILEKFNDLFDNIRSLKPTVFSSFKTFLTEILEMTEDISDILTLQPFLQIIAHFPLESKHELSTSIAQAFLNRGEGKITDPVVVHIILSLIKNVPQEKSKKFALKFLQIIDFGNDLEQTLNFYAQMRASFGQIQSVIVSLIYKAAGLTFKARKLNKGRVTNKLISFLQATLAYCFITVPVLSNNHLKLKLYIYLSEVALTNNLISQATSLIKTCITELSQAESETDQEIYSVFYRIISFLIVMPDDPQNEFLFLFNGLFQAFTKAKFRTNYENILRFEFYTKCIVYLSCQAQQRLPFHIQGVISNDGLFKSIQFRRALVEKIMQMADLIEQVLPKIDGINGNLEIDSYTLIHLSQCAMTLITTFQSGPRLKKIMKGIVKIVEKCKDKVFGKEQKAMQTTYRTCLIGLNKKLEESELGIKIQI